MRFLLLALSSLLPLAAMAGEWSGVVTMEEFINAPRANEDERKELEDYLLQLRQRLVAITARRRQAATQSMSPDVERTLAQDESFVRAELEQVAVARGGLVPVHRTMLWVDGARVRADGDGLVIADRDLGRAWVWSERGFTQVMLEDPPATATGGVVVAEKRQQFSLTLPDRRVVQAVVRMDRPNPFATLMVPAGASPLGDVARSLAALPGLPESVDVPGPLPRRLVLVSTDGAVDPEKVAPPSTP